MVFVLTLFNNESTGAAEKMNTKLNLGAVEPGAEELIEYHLKVPQLHPTLINKDAISVSYTLHFAVKISLHIYYIYITNIHILFWA